MFPHRLNPDKQPEIARDLLEGNTADVVFTQEHKWSKSEYYQRLGSASAVFSCALHENLGISVMEGVFAGAIPIVPDRCSYSEMYLPVFKYPSEWTESWDSYQKHKYELNKYVKHKVDYCEQYSLHLEEQKQILLEKFMSPKVMIDRLTRKDNVPSIVSS
jgi:hypothetical protein